MKHWSWASDEAILTYARPLATFALTLAGLLIARRICIRWLFKRARGPETLSRITLDTLRAPSLLWCFAAAVKFGLDMSLIPEKYTGRASTAIEAFILLSITMVVASTAESAFIGLGRRRGAEFAFSGLARTLIRIVVFSLGLVALLHLYSVNVTPLLTALGVGGLAVALALQDTLANFFAGVHILIEAPISFGNYIKLSTGEEGMVTDIGWRTTRLRNGNNNVVVIPNTKITSGILINYNLPDARVSADVAVMVGHDADVDQVRRLALEETLNTSGVLDTPPPTVLFTPGLLSTHLQFTVTFYAADFTQRGALQSDVRLRIHRRLKREGVPLPLPPAEVRMLATD